MLFEWLSIPVVLLGRLCCLNSTKRIILVRTRMGIVLRTTRAFAIP